MKKVILTAVAVCAMAFCAVADDKPATKGAELGEWTMDVSAAKKLAKSKNKPVFLCFTGSDWCGWCKLMEKNVFSADAWEDYAEKNLVLVWIDFPRDKTLVPEKFVSRNRELAQKYKVQGYPTYVILSSSGKELGRLGASRSATPEEFIRSVEGVLALQRMDTALTAEEQKLYQAALKEKEELEKKIDAWSEKLRKESADFEAAMKAVDQKIEAFVEKARKSAK